MILEMIQFVIKTGPYFYYFDLDKKYHYALDS